MKLFGIVILSVKEHEELREKADAVETVMVGFAWLTRLVEAHGAGEGVLDALRGQVEALKELVEKYRPAWTMDQLLKANETEAHGASLEGQALNAYNLSLFARQGRNPFQ
jgi:hypothetical protein